MIIKELCECITTNVDSLISYSDLVSTIALIFSILSFVISQIIATNRVKKEKEISNARYEEQKRQYEERLNEERKRREEDKSDMEERNRICEQPYLVFKGVQRIKKVPSSSGDQIIFSMSFLNKGRGSAYEIIPDVNCTASHYGDTFTLYRHGAVEDPIAMVNESFVMEWCYIGKEIYEYRMPFSICYKDASGRKYIQKYVVDIVDENESNIITYANPEICD